jgi:hypothetical protein
VRRGRRWTLLGALALAACGGSSSPGTASKACNPLAADPKPITLGLVVGAGRDSAGVVYVIDRPQGGAEDRLFVSDGTKLVRQPVGGSGSGAQPGGGTFEVVGSGTGDAMLTVEIGTDGGGGVMMGVVHGAFASRTFTIGEQGEALTVLAPGELSAFTVENLPGTIYVEYVATLPDGRTLVVTRPEVDWSYSDFRLFLSTSATSPLLERKVASVLRGSFTDITFDLDGTPAKAHFSDSLSPGPSTLTVGSAAPLDLTVRPPGTAPNGPTFLCF